MKLNKPTGNRSPWDELIKQQDGMNLPKNPQRPRSYSDFAQPQQPVQPSGFGGGFWGSLIGGVQGASQQPMQPQQPTAYNSFYQQQFEQNQNAYDKQMAYLTAENQKLLEQIQKHSAKATDNAKNYYDMLLKQIDTGLTDANRRADVAEQRGTVDARNAYAENVATRGANAEQLAQMGLSGSGYGDLIDAQAYGQQRAEIANVRGATEKARNDAKAQADEMRNKGQLDYQSLLDEIRNNESDATFQAQSNYDKAKHDAEMRYDENLFGIKQSQEAQKMEDEQRAEEEKRVQEQAEKDKNRYDEYLANNAEALGLKNHEIMKGRVDRGELTKEQAQDLGFRLYNNQTIDKNLAKQIQDDYKAGFLSEKQMQQLKDKYSEDNAFSDKSAFIGEDMTIVSPEEAEKQLKEVKADSMLSQAEKDKWQKHYDYMYTPTVKGQSKIEWYQDKALGSAPQSNDANFIITANGKEYKVQSTGIEDNAELNELAKDIQDGQVFTIRGDIFVKTRGKIIGVEGRSTSQKGYEALKKDILG